MLGGFLFVAMVGSLGLIAYQMHQFQLRALALDRFQVEESIPLIETPSESVQAVIKRYIWAPWVVGVVIGLVIYFLTGISWMISGTIGINISLLLAILEVWNAQRQAIRLEEQLAEAIDLMIGTLGAGAGLSSAMTVVIEEVREPLKAQFQEVMGRINYGDDPQQVFSQLAAKIPLDTFLLFASALAVHWEVGGNLTPTLSAVGRTIRDRLEITRRIRSNSTQSDISTVAILGLTYFVALVMWRNSPEQMAAFISSSMGEFFISGSMLLQAVGIVWMNWLSRPNF